MTDPLHLSGEVTVGGTITHKFTDAEEYDRFVRGNLERSPVRATLEAHFPKRPREHRPCLWGWRKGYVQYGSPDDRWEELLSRGEVSLVVPQVEYERDAARLQARATP